MFIDSPEEFKEAWQKGQKQFIKSVEDYSELIERYIRDKNPFKEEKFVNTFGSSFPKVNVWQTGYEIEVTADVAGYKKERISIELNGSCLIINGKASSGDDDASQHPGQFILNELKRSSFSRKINLPVGKYINENITAQLEEGVLKIRIPINKADEKPKSVKINIK